MSMNNYNVSLSITATQTMPAEEPTLAADGLMSDFDWLSSQKSILGSLATLFTIQSLLSIAIDSIRQTSHGFGSNSEPIENLYSKWVDSELGDLQNTMAQYAGADGRFSREEFQVLAKEIFKLDTDSANAIFDALVTKKSSSGGCPFSQSVQPRTE